jgi:hypothetical protein
VFCNKRFKAYLYGRHCKYIFENEPLVTMRKLKDPMGRIGNLLNKLQDTDYDMIYQPGALHVTPDLFSRPSTVVEVYSVEFAFSSCVNWEKEQVVDGKLVHVLNLLTGTDVDDESKWSEFASCEVLNVLSCVSINSKWNFNARMRAKI